MTIDLLAILISSLIPRLRLLFFFQRILRVALNSDIRLDRPTTRRRQLSDGLDRMTQSENSHRNLVQGLSEKIKRLLLESDDLTLSEKATLGAKVTPSTSLTGNYRHVAENLRLEIDTRKWEVSESSKVHLSVHACTSISS